MQRSELSNFLKARKSTETFWVLPQEKFLPHIFLFVFLVKIMLYHRLMTDCSQAPRNPNVHCLSASVDDLIFTTMLAQNKSGAYLQATVMQRKHPSPIGCPLASVWPHSTSCAAGWHHWEISSKSQVYRLPTKLPLTVRIHPLSC